IVVNAALDGGAVDLDAGTTLAVNQAINAGADDITLLSGGNMSFGVNGDITTTGIVDATSGAAISMADGAVIDAGSVALLADTNVALGRIVSAGTVDVMATNGAITDNTALDGAGNENIVGSIVTLNAGTNIGTYQLNGGHAGDIDIDAVELTAVLSSDGQIGIFESDDVYLNTVDAGLTSGEVIVEAVGNIDDHDDDQLADVTADVGELIAGGTIGGNPQVGGGDLSLDVNVSDITLDAGGATDVLDVGFGTVLL